jgi:hypothetical protein
MLVLVHTTFYYLIHACYRRRSMGLHDCVLIYSIPSSFDYLTCSNSIDWVAVAFNLDVVDDGHLVCCCCTRLQFSSTCYTSTCYRNFPMASRLPRTLGLCTRGTPKVSLHWLSINCRLFLHFLTMHLFVESLSLSLMCSLCFFWLLTLPLPFRPTRQTEARAGTEK